MRSIFFDQQYQHQIEKEGYCLIPLFTEEEIRGLEKVYYTNLVTEQPSIELTLKSEDYELKKKIADGITAIIIGKLTCLLENYTSVFSGFITKKPGKDNVSALHQDPTVTDEEKFPSVNVWIPLTDVDEQNGAVHIIKRSHLFFPGFRSNRVGRYDFNEIKSEVMKHFGTPVRMKRGEVLIYDTRLFHFSNQNITDKLRIAVASIYIPKEATPIYYYHNQAKSAIELYEISNDFYLNYMDRFFRGSITKERLLSSTAYQAPTKVDLKAFKRAYELHNNTEIWKLLLKRIGL